LGASVPNGRDAVDHPRVVWSSGADARAVLHPSIRERLDMPGHVRS